MNCLQGYETSGLNDRFQYLSPPLRSTAEVVMGFVRRDSWMTSTLQTTPLDRLTRKAQNIASRERGLMKHDLEEAMTPAWVIKDKQRAEYLQRIVQVERQMGSVR